MALRRRRLLELCGTAAAVGLAGCLGDSMPGEDDPTHENVSDGTVDYPGMVDGGASVTADRYVTIEYDDPETSFILQPIYEGEEASDDQFRVQRDLSGETMAGFIAPVHTGEAFEYHVFANEAFVEFADWNVVTGTGQNLTDGENPGFERLQGPVYGMVLSPGEAELLAIVDTTAEELQSRDGPSPTGLAIIRGASGGQPEQSVPQISFGFEYDATAEQLTVTHEGGDSVDASRLEFQSDADITVDDDFEGTVAAGDAATLTAPSDAEVRIIWTSAEGDTSATLAAWKGSDA
ncbi:hypothetical protein HWV23_00185 [Natronomonas halophila]|uniref:hypothetical protein n=1 Tax=Natronomonas halophila TaxID=2747817 RepID=UPI0015B44578|nr:hypothetical protein [Natronomonas halophila]QLD84185.1 hypothetical protein HWV23_00185 [Natronomonas halophila]